MDLKADFLAALISPPRIPAASAPEDFLGQCCDIDNQTDSPLFQVLSGGAIRAYSPYSFDIRSLSCYLLLYTKAGSGKLLIENQIYTLSQGTLLFLDCSRHFRIDIATEPWEYEVFYIRGSSLASYYSMLPERVSLTPVSPHCDLALQLGKLSLFAKENSTASGLIVSSLIDTVITSCILHALASDNRKKMVPSYLWEMKKLFDEEYDRNYPLDELEVRFHISKYRLCREFAEAYGMPPLKYQNHRRIEVAKQLLLTTSLKVHEVGSRVGIDNTNHFISLFKRATGCTPFLYKQHGFALSSKE